MPSDHSESVEIEKRLMQAAKKLQQLAPLLGMAKTVKEYNSDQKKNALSRLVVRFLKAGESVSSAEHQARALPEFEAKMEELQSALENAEKTIADYAGTEAAWNTCRSLLAMSRETIRQL